MALNLFGVTFNDVQHASAPPDGLQSVAVRDLAAIVAECAYEALEPDEQRVARVADVMRLYAARGAVLPAPVGLVFRSREAVLRWLELHYVALSDALSFVDDRVVGRVHVSRPPEDGDRDPSADLSTAAADGLRALRRSAVATVPLRVEPSTGAVLSAAFLVERETWKDFGARVDEQGTRAPNLRFSLTGPWPPFDFVQMQFGG